MFDIILNFISTLFGNNELLPQLFYVILASIIVYSVFIRNIIRLVTTKSFIRYSDIIFTIICSITLYFSLKGGVSFA